MARYTDAGSRLEITSLAGIPSRPGLGLLIEYTRLTPSGAYSLAAVSNPGRVWLLITNDGANDIIVQYAEEGTTSGHILRAGGSILFNHDMPWSGSVFVYCAGAGVATVSEASIQT